MTKEECKKEMMSLDHDTIASDDESESWSNSKGTQLRGFGQSGRDVVLLQDIEPKVLFLILRGLYTYMGTALKLPLNLVSYNKTLGQLS